ncbi:DegT/DnrJ/EryC1/StrS family aminotransferase [Peribacillus huizhouensis]|uniref:dTDP-4-amino-4,6-dideoxygalactose transaminase n=1 Tax=Peribacillus huizhouensis TaxID=1501239 RepID=A0ABR6CM58_9BACI|nr:DegT/DnrJ/EryC1/StrS family aminotransferase [Peribacillus huizhouensis]MBA9025650.1 dTDP-4-amino-4,6-dideoxygalactose transaminase [Peribacillus huizhouensis]
MVPPFIEPIYVTRPLLADKENIKNKIDEIWESKWLTNNGTQHKELEKELKKYLRVENLSLFNNGTLALLLGLKSLELKGEVITTPFTFPATVQALDWNGLTPVFCDIDPQTLNIDANKIEALITKDTSAILGVHVFGNPCDVVNIQKIADKYNLKVIYDGAHVFGTKINGKPIGSFGDMTMFSFHATKLFNTLEGGGLTVKDEKVNERVKILKNFGLLGPEEVVLCGLNAKMNEVQAGIGLEVLKLVDEERVKRDKIKETYENNLLNIPGIRIITILKNEYSSYQYFVIEIDEEKYGRSRDWVHDELEKYNVFTRKYFYPLCSDFEWYKHLASAQPENLPQAQKSVKQVLSMPYYGELELESVEKICAILKKIHSEISVDNQYQLVGDML